MAKKKLVVANWKMNPGTVDQARKLARQIEHGLLALDRGSAETVICPPYLFLPVVKHAVRFAKLGAQDLSPEEKGAFTGQISASQLAGCGVKYAVIGHSERRLLGEGDEFLNQKVKAAVSHGIEPILCVGYGSKPSSTVANVKRIVKKQLDINLRGLNFRKYSITIAYEPLWVIGTGKPATPEHAADIMRFIKVSYPMARILYGGSVGGSNAREFAAAGLQGVLVGGASLEARGFTKIAAEFANSTS